MLLVNGKPIEGIESEDNQSQYADEVRKGIKRLKQDFGDQMKFVRPGYPRKNKGIDSRGQEVDNMTEPPPPYRIPLQARVTNRSGMEEIWDYCAGRAIPQPNGLWQPTGKRAITPTDTLVVNLKNDGELAFFLYYKSPHIKSGQWKVYDPDKEAREKGDRKRRELDLNHALYSVLGDDNVEQLKIVAQAYGVSRTDKKHPDVIREELEKIVLLGDDRKRSDPTAKGVSEFLEEVKVTDSVRLRSLIMIALDEGKIRWSPEGKYKVGDRELCKVPANELPRKQDYLCNHLSYAANRPKLQELLRDIISREYLDKSDDKVMFYLARVMNLRHEFRPKEEIRENVYECFVAGYEKAEPEPVTVEQTEPEPKKPPVKKKVNT